MKSGHYVVKLLIAGPKSWRPLKKTRDFYYPITGVHCDRDHCSVLSLFLTQLSRTYRQNAHFLPPLFPSFFDTLYCPSTGTPVRLLTQPSFTLPELQLLQVIGQVVSVDLHAGALVGEDFYLLPQLPHFLLVHFSHAAVPLAALQLLNLHHQRSILLLQETHLLDVAGEAVVEVLELGLLVGPCVEEVLVHGVGQVEVEFLARIGAHGRGGAEPSCPGTRGHPV